VRWCRLLALLLICVPIPLAVAAELGDVYPQVRNFFPQANRFGGFEGTPEAAGVYRGNELLGYVFFTHDVLRIPAYSGKPINTLVGFDLTGRIAGVAIVEHEEPILAVGITRERLDQFTEQYQGKSVFDRITIGAKREGYTHLDGISGATITVMVENATVMRAARQVAESRGILLPGTPPAAREAAAYVPPPAAAPALPEPAGPAAKPTKPPAPPKVARQPPRPAPGYEPGVPPPPAAAAPGAREEPVWIGVWQERTLQIAVLAVGLVCLSLILVFQDWMARHPTLLHRVRNAFLLYTIFFVGWYGLAQLSVINVLTFAHAVMRDFRWETFLVDPMLFILWSFVAVTLLLWGRGVYCGWLCPFGALQELTQQVARRFNVPQLEFPDVVHERLWALKYIILLGLFAVSLQSMSEAAVYAEVEPFKTAVSMRFQREWPFVLYAAGLVVVSAFNRKFFCKYLCPLGAALTIPGRFRLFDWWLRRRKECGKPCQVCAVDCGVRAIRSTGEINANECHYCLDCQVIYYSDRKCPPLIERRKRRDRLPRAREAVREIEQTMGPYGEEALGRDRGDPGRRPTPPGANS